MDTAVVPYNTLEPLVGDPVPNWTARPKPSASTLVGKFCRLERLDPDRHAAELFAANGLDSAGHDWTYLPYGPFAELEPYRRWVEQAASGEDPRFYAIIDTDSGAAGEAAVGVLSLMRVKPDAGSIEVGHIRYSPLLQRRRGATEAQLLLMGYVFDELGYRRYEWKCDALHARSRAAAERLGFRYEGTFRQAQVVKGRNRDTAWYSMLDREWPQVAAAGRAWLVADNFDEQGRQRAALRRTSTVNKEHLTTDCRPR